MATMATNKEKQTKQKDNTSGTSEMSENNYNLRPNFPDDHTQLVLLTKARLMVFCIALRSLITLRQRPRKTTLKNHLSCSEQTRLNNCRPMSNKK